MACSDLRRFHQLLPKLGIRAGGYSSQGEEHFTLEAARAHMIKVGSNHLRVLEATLGSMPLRGLLKSGWATFSHWTKLRPLSSALRNRLQEVMVLPRS
eukprot:3204382-Heterocapsa_arctica.AAC.1